MMALPIIVAVLLLFVPVPEGLPPYAWHYFAIFVGVIVGLIFEPLPGAVIGILRRGSYCLVQPVAAVQPGSDGRARLQNGWRLL